MSETKTVTVTKVGGTSAPPVMRAATRKVVPRAPKFGILKRGKTARRKPRFEAVRDPTSAPPLRKSLRILTSKGESTRRARFSDESKRLPIQTIRETLKRNKLPVTSKREEIVRKIYADAQEAGMLSSS